VETPQTPPGAALLVIGNEILSGKVRDENTPFLAQELFDLGWAFREVSIVGDVQEDIVENLKRLLARHEYVFTSGGVGPTHDDITLQSIALATGRRLVLSPMLERLIKKYYKSDVLTPAQQRLAMIPEGSVLHYGPDSIYPQMVVDRVYPLPGIPDLFRRKFQELKSLWPEVDKPLRHCFKMIAMETDLAAPLGALAQEHPDVSVGSYPTEKVGIWHLELVLESRKHDALDEAVDALRRVLDGREISWQETPESSRD
jgi:molybdenum cofactor synthesis domain-containing protein